MLLLRQRSAWGADEARGSDPVYLKGIKQAHVHHTASSSATHAPRCRGSSGACTGTNPEASGATSATTSSSIASGGSGSAGRRVPQARQGRPHARLQPLLVRRRVDRQPRGVRHPQAGEACAGAPDRLEARQRGPLAAGLREDHLQGSDRYPTRTRVRLPVVTGHRDTNLTACPGASLYVALPKIRRGAQRRVDMFN